MQFIAEKVKCFMLLSLDRYKAMDKTAFLEMKVIKVMKCLPKKTVNLLGALLIITVYTYLLTVMVLTS